MTTHPEVAARGGFAASGSAPVRLAIVGCGRLAEAGYLPALGRAEGVELAAVADRDRERARRLSGAARAPRREVSAHGSLTELLAAEPVDAVLLATPARAHLEDARIAAAAGLPVLVEKPPALDAPEARELARLDPAPHVGFNRRFDPRLGALRTRLADSRRPRLRLELRYRRRSWRPYEAADDALTDLAPHLLDLAGWLLGARVVAVSARTRGDTRAALEVELDGGRALATCATDRPWREVVEARGEEAPATSVADGGLGGTARALSGRLRGSARDHPLVASLARQLEAFAGAARGRPDPALATAAEGAAVMEAVAAARRSAKRGGAREPVEL